MATFRQRGDKWQAIVRIKRGGAIVHQESQTFDTERLARSWAQRVEDRIAAEGVPSRQLKTQTLGALLLKYLETLESHGAIRRTRAAEIVQLAPYFETLALAEVNSSVFSAFATKRRKEGAGATTVLHNLATVRSALNAAKPMYGYDITGGSVAEAIDALKRAGVVARSDSRERRPSQAELDAICVDFDRVAHFPSTVIPMRTFVELAVAWPRRLGELCKMTWSDFNKMTGIQTLRDTKHPTAPRLEVVPLTPEARRIIEALPVIDERILPYSPESVGKSFQRACARLKIKDLHFHDLRHEGISRLFERGLSIQEVALVSGHQSWTMLRRYTHLSATTLSEKLNAGT